MAVTYYGYKSNAYGASSKATDPYFSYQTVTHSGTQANQTVVSIDACSISNANTNGSSSGGYRMNIEAQINGTWYTLGYISVAKQEASHQTFSNFTPTADASLRSLMGKMPPTALRGKVDAGYFHLNAGSTLQLSATTQMDYTSCTEPAAVSLSAAQSEGNVTLSWSGAQAGSNNAITGYEVQYQESADNSSWSAWKALTTVSTSAASGSLSVAPPATRGYYRRFQLRTMGTAGGSYYSPWKISANSVRRYILSTLSLSPQTVTADESITATLGISHSDLTHKVTIVFGNYSKAQELAAGVSSYTFKVQPDWLSQIPTSLSGTATCTLETRSGSTIIDTRSAAFTIACPASAVPTIGSMSVSPVSDVVPSEWQIYVNGYSKALIQASGIMTGMGASVTEYRIAGGDYASGKITYTSDIAHTTALINRSGLVDLTLMVYDSRGLNTQKSATVTFVDYSTPAIESFKAYRVNDVGAVDPNGTRIAGDVSYSYNQLSGKNTAMVSINVDNTAVLSNVPLPQGNGIYSFILPATYEISKSFTVKATLKDKLSQQAAGSVVINTSARKINVGGGKNGGVALGKMSEHDKTLELASDWKLRLGQTDVAAAITNAANSLPKTNVVNNLTTTNEGYALDARMGKVLAEAFSNPNLLINGDFKIWQRGTSFGPNISMYTADRWVKSWYAYVGKWFSDRQGLAMSSTGTTNQIGIYQHIEDLTLPGKIVTLTISCELGLFSTTLTAPTQSSGVTPIGAIPLGNDQGYIYMDNPTGYPRVAILLNPGKTLGIYWVKLELGNVATPFVPKSFAEEQLTCYRYFIGYNPDTWLKMQHMFGEHASVILHLPTRPRLDPPTVGVLSPMVYSSVITGWAGVTFTTIQMHGNIAKLYFDSHGHTQFGDVRLFKGLVGLDSEM